MILLEIGNRILAETVDSLINAPPPEEDDKDEKEEKRGVKNPKRNHSMFICAISMGSHTGS